jgi:hypothetical protein
VAAKSLAEEIASLTPEERESVKQFIVFLKSKEAGGTSQFLTAVDEFIEQHPELLRRLAQ